MPKHPTEIQTIALCKMEANSNFLSLLKCKKQAQRIIAEACDTKEVIGIMFFKEYPKRTVVVTIFTLLAIYDSQQSLA